MYSIKNYRKIRKLLLNSLILGILLLSACQRFEDSFNPQYQPTISDFFSNFSNLIASTSPEEFQEKLTEYFAADYLNNGMSAQATIEVIADSSSGYDLEAKLLRTSDNKIEWALIRNNGAKGDSIIFVDNVRLSESSYKFCGNQTSISFSAFIQQYLTGLANYMNNTIDDLSPYLADDYLNNGDNATDLLTVFREIKTLGAEDLLISLVDSEEFPYEFKYELNDHVIGLDLEFTDFLGVADTGFKLVGNGKEGLQSQRKILAQMFVGFGCLSCTYPEAALHRLMQKYEGQLLYLEHHVFNYDPMYIRENLEEMSFYHLQMVPYTVFMGTDVYGQIEEQTFQLYQQVIENYLQQPIIAELTISNVTNQNSQLTAEVAITLHQQISANGLFLMGAFVERVNENFLNAAGENYRQVVLDMNSQEVTNLAENQVINVEIPQNAPDDIEFYLWLQKRTENKEQDTYVYDIKEVEFN